MKIPAARLDAFCRRPDAGIRAVLVYGPDAGLIRERADLLGRSAVADLDDPFRVSVLTGAAVVADPPRLAEEVAAMSLVGGRRLVRLRDAGDAAAPALSRALQDGAAGDTLLVVEAGELRPTSPLRKLFESAGSAAAVPCYVDEGAALERVLRDTLAQHRVNLDGAAAHWLSAHLGGDRGILRGEAEKLALYVGDGGTVSVEDCVAVVGDSIEIAVDAVVSATAGGDRRRLERFLDRVFAEGEQPIRLLRALQRHFLRLLTLTAAVEAGARPQAAVDALRPRPHFKEAPLLTAQLQRWTRPGIARAIARLADAEADCKRASYPAELVCRHALDELARQAMRR